MTRNGASDKNGVSYVRLSLNDYIKLAALGIGLISLIVTSQIALSGILAHINDKERHQTEAQKRRLVREETAWIGREIDHLEEADIRHDQLIQALTEFHLKD